MFDDDQQDDSVELDESYVIDDTAESEEDESERDGDDGDENLSYWATWKGSSLSSALDEQETQYFESARTRGLLTMWIVAYAAHYGLTPEDLRDFSTQQMGYAGNEMELIRFHINVVRGYARAQTTMALGDRAAFRGVVVNDDHRSWAKSELADGIINGLYKRYAAPIDPLAAESDGQFGSGANHTRWNFHGGDDVTTYEPIELEDGTQTQRAKKAKSGAPVTSAVYPWSLAQETHASAEPLWYIVREPESKWNLIAQYPDKRDDILNVSDSPDRWDFRQLFRLEDLDYSNRDQVTVKHFYHAACAALPMGRYVQKYGDVLLWDGPCPTRQGMPVSIIRSGSFIETTFGYADIWDMLAIQQALNQLNSDEMQNYATFGRQSVAMEQGTKVTADALAKGAAFYVPQGAKMPQAIQLVAPPPTLPVLKDYLHRMLDQVSGQNAASRGDPDPNVRSGEMAALLDSISLRYQSFRQEGVRNFRIRTAEIYLDLIDRYGTTPFLVEMVGVDSRTFLSEYTKDDLSAVKRITIEAIPPAMQSAAYRLELYDKLMKLPAHERAPAYEMVINGNTGQFLKADRSSEIYIKRENERLVTDESDVFVSATDDPFTHMPEHRALRERILSSDNPDMEAIKRIDAHMVDHGQVYLGMSPLSCAFFGIQPPPAIQPNQNNPNGNAAYQFQVMTGAAPPPGAAPAPAAAGGAGPANGGKSQQMPANAGESSSGAAQRSAQNGTQETHPSGTPLPSPSQPPS